MVCGSRRVKVNLADSDRVNGMKYESSLQSKALTSVQVSQLANEPKRTLMDIWLERKPRKIGFNCSSCITLTNRNKRRVKVNLVG